MTTPLLPMAELVSRYFTFLVAGDVDALIGLFEGEPVIDHPTGGRVAGAQAVADFARARSKWLAERQARVEPLRTTHGAGRSVAEIVLHLVMEGRAIPLPLAVVGDKAGADRLREVRVYHSSWPLQGAHRVRSPLLPRDESVILPDVIADYQQALKDGDVDAIMNTFEPDGYFREPAGGEHAHRGTEQLRAFMVRLLASGGIPLEHCTVTDDGVACAVEFNAVQFGPHVLRPQAGVAVYERGPSGRLHAARIYDDVNVEAYAA